MPRPLRPPHPYDRPTLFGLVLACTGLATLAFVVIVTWIEGGPRP